MIGFAGRWGGGLVALAACGVLTLWPGGVREATGQEVGFERGTGGLARADAAIREILARDRYRLIVRDTLIAPGERVTGDLIVLGAGVRLEGSVDGDVVVVRGDLFARPGSRIEGRVVVIGPGGFYGSSLAEVPVPPIDAAYLAYDYRGDDGTYVITGPVARGGLRLPGLYGLLLPLYDRVNAVSLTWGVELEPVGSKAVPQSSARVSYRTARDRVDATLALSWPVARHAVEFAGGREPRTQDEWIVGDVINSIEALLSAVDLRNYYEARFARAGARIAHGDRLDWTHRLSLEWEEASSLVNQAPFSIFEDRLGFHENRRIDPGDVWGVRLGTHVAYRSVSGLPLEVDATVEAANRDVAGDFTFTLLSGGAVIAVPTLRDQGLALRARGQAVLSSGAPRQRWRGLGGLHTLPTLERLGRFGDRMWWVEASYFLPSPLGVAGLARLRPWLRYTAGNAWSGIGERPGTIHNAGVGLEFGYVAVGVYANPEEGFETIVVLGLQAPLYPRIGG